MVNFNPGLSQLLIKVFLTKDTAIRAKKTTIEPLLRNTALITQNVTLSNT